MSGPFQRAVDRPIPVVDALVQVPRAKPRLRMLVRNFPKRRHNVFAVANQVYEFRIRRESIDQRDMEDMTRVFSTHNRLPAASVLASNRLTNLFANESRHQ